MKSISLARISFNTIRLIKENRAFIIFLVLMFAFRSSFADWNTVPTGSMKPTIVEGDRILVNKMAYDLRIPFTHISLLKIAEPQRGDIIVFDSKASEKRLVKRVIGIPGDSVAIAGNRVFVNGESLRYQPLNSSSGLSTWTEATGDKAYRIQFEYHWDDDVDRGNLAPLTVPEGYLFVMGDNRNNSMDSRFIGLVPRGELVGQTRSVVMSLNYDNYYIPRSGRFFHTL